jgi:aminotransferase
LICPKTSSEAAIKAIEDNASHYAHTSGEIGVRKAVSEFLEKQYDLHYDPETEIVMTVGATEGLFAAAFGLLNPGDQVIIPSPFFPLYSYAVELNRGECILVDTSDTGFLMTPELLHKTMARKQKCQSALFELPEQSDRRHLYKRRTDRLWPMRSSSTTSLC